MKNIITASELPTGYRGPLMVEGVNKFSSITATGVEHGVGTNNLTRISSDDFEDGYELFNPTYRVVLDPADQYKFEVRGADAS